MTLDHRIPAETPQAPGTPRVVGISGMIFSALYIASLVLVRLSMPADPADPGEWLADPSRRDSVRVALNMIPFTGIAFLWFMGVLRNRVGALEDRFMSTVFLGSGLLFVGMLFAIGAVAGGLLETLGADGRPPVQSETYAICRRATYILMNTYALKMAAVFMFVTSTIGLRTAILPRWIPIGGFAFGLVMLLAITDSAWIALLFPLWVLVVSTYILVADFGLSPGASN
jgi:hypothetical protein